MVCEIFVDKESYLKVVEQVSLVPVIVSLSYQREHILHTRRNLRLSGALLRRRSPRRKQMVLLRRLGVRLRVPLLCLARHREPILDLRAQHRLQLAPAALRSRRARRHGAQPCHKPAVRLHSRGVGGALTLLQRGDRLSRHVSHRVGLRTHRGDGVRDRAAQLRVRLRQHLAQLRARRVDALSQRARLRRGPVCNGRDLVAQCVFAGALGGFDTRQSLAVLLGAGVGGALLLLLRFGQERPDPLVFGRHGLLRGLVQRHMFSRVLKSADFAGELLQVALVNRGAAGRRGSSLSSSGGDASHSLVQTGELGARAGCLTSSSPEKEQAKRYTLEKTQK